MKNKTKIWLDYTAENLESAQILLDSNFFNSCLQNVQQYVEKLFLWDFSQKGERVNRSVPILNA